MLKKPENMSELERLLNPHSDGQFVETILIDLAGEPIGKRYPINDLRKLDENATQFCAGTTMLGVLSESQDVFRIDFFDGDPSIGYALGSHGSGLNKTT